MSFRETDLCFVVRYKKSAGLPGLHLGLLANLAALYESSSRVHLRKQPFSVSSKKVGRVNAPRNVGYVFEDTRVVVEVCSKSEIAKKRVSPVLL